MAKRLYLDLETYSSIDLKTSGGYKYTESIDFEILLLAYAIDDGDIRIIDLIQCEPIPEEFTNLLLDPSVEKWAHNATFERNSLKQYGFDIPIEQWYCSAVKSAYCGLPISLELVSKAMKLEEKGKLSTGKALIRYFCNPCKPTKVNGMRHRNRPEHNQAKWSELKRYCVNDVEAERQIILRLDKFDMPDFERANYIIDQEINDAGVLIDQNMVTNAIEIDNQFRDKITLEMVRLTGMDNPNSPKQMKEWIERESGIMVESLAKDNVEALLKQVTDPSVKMVLEGRLKLAKSSTKKYVAMVNCVCDNDGRAHGLFQFYGANRTGRWAGRLIQLQNLPQNHMRELEEVRDIVCSGGYHILSERYDNIPNVLSELIRTAIISPEGKTFAVSDFSAIEARVLSWVAGEEWRMDVFRTHGKIYEASAAMMFGVPIESVTKGSDLRQRGKTAELALGYQGSEGAMEKMDREGKIPKNELKPLVTKWRKANPSIVKLWGNVNDYAIHTIRTGKSIKLGCLKFHLKHNVFMIELPSGRSLYYNNPRIGTNRFGMESIIFKGMNNLTAQWEDVETYGGKLVENIVQAISRDLLTYSMQTLKSEGFKMVMHVHDEVICEVPVDNAEEELKRMEELMGLEIPWAQGLPLVADGYVTKFYKKD